ncbi:MAG: TetR/AcrR family transcriptional regulator [Alphaproteobacteria bacterium]
MARSAKKLPPRRGRPVDTKKRDQILDAATCLFMEQGFTQTRMDHIAKAARISKQTLYDRFPDKKKLFTAVIEAKCHEYIPREAAEMPTGTTARETLLAIGHGLFYLVMSEEAVRMHRMMAAEAQHNPALTKLFYDSGPAAVEQMIIEKMSQLKKSGLLKIKNPKTAKEIFGSLFTGSDLYMRRLLNIGRQPTRREMDAHVQHAVDFFLSGHH